MRLLLPIFVLVVTNFAHAGGQCPDFNCSWSKFESILLDSRAKLEQPVSESELPEEIRGLSNEEIITFDTRVGNLMDYMNEAGMDITALNQANLNISFYVSSLTTTPRGDELPHLNKEEGRALALQAIPNVMQELRTIQNHMDQMDQLTSETLKTLQ